MPMSKPNERKTPREIIERIRTHRYLLDVDGESEMREGALTALLRACRDRLKRV